MDLAELDGFLSDAWYTSRLEPIGAGEFDLIVVPEPSSVVPFAVASLVCKARFRMATSWTSSADSEAILAGRARSKTQSKATLQSVSCLLHVRSRHIFENAKVKRIGQVSLSNVCAGVGTIRQMLISVVTQPSGYARDSLGCSERLVKASLFTC